MDSPLRRYMDQSAAIAQRTSSSVAVAPAASRSSETCIYLLVLAALIALVITAKILAPNHPLVHATETDSRTESLMVSE